MRHALVIGSLVLGLSSAVGGAQEPPDLEFNPATGQVESVDVTDDAAHRIRHVADRGQGRNRTVTIVSADQGERPRIAIQGSGDSWVVWSAGTSPNGLFYAKRTLQTETWSGPVALSSPADDGRDPEIVSHGPGIWIAYEIRLGATRSLVVTGVIDTPEPMPCTTPIATTLFEGDLDLALHSAGEHLWATWVQNAESVGWSVRNPQTGQWSAPQLVPVVLPGIEAALSTVEAIVTQP